MQSPWGDIRISDAHIHFFSHNFFKKIAAQKGNSPLEETVKILEWRMPPENPAELAELWIQELDRFGIARAALIASVPGDEASVITAVERFPKRFYGYFMADPTAAGAPKAAAQLLANGPLRGVCLFPAMHRYSLADDRLKPILEAAASQSGRVVFVHCGVLTVGFRKKLGLPSPFDMRYSNPIDLHAVALRYPAANFVVPHFGAGYFREALMLCDLCPNVYLDTSSTNSWVRYQPEAMDLKRVFAQALQVAGAGRLLFGSDSSFFPRGWNAQIYESQARVLLDLGLTEAQARAVFSGNLEGLMADRTA